MRIIEPDLPIASDTEQGAVQVNGDGLTATNGVISVDNTVTPQASRSFTLLILMVGQVVGSPIESGDLPLATNTNPNIIAPGS